MLLIPLLHRTKSLLLPFCSTCSALQEKMEPCVSLMTGYVSKAITEYEKIYILSSPHISYAHPSLFKGQCFRTQGQITKLASREETSSKENHAMVPQNLPRMPPYAYLPPSPFLPSNNLPFPLQTGKHKGYPGTSGFPATVRRGSNIHHPSPRILMIRFNAV